MVLLYFLLYFILGRAALAYGLTAAITLGFTMGSWFKLQFRNDPLMFEDLLLLKEAGNMAGKYQLFLTKTMILALVVLILGWLFLHFCVRGRPGARLRLLGFALAVLCALPVWDMTQSDDIYNNRTANIRRTAAPRGETPHQPVVGHPGLRLQGLRLPIPPQRKVGLRRPAGGL